MIRFWAATGVPAQEALSCCCPIEIPAGRDGIEVKRILPAPSPCVGRIGESACFGRRDDAQDHGVTGRSSR
jgi:hypothetical protein